MNLALGLINTKQSEQLNKKIVLVTGATSQIGLCVVRRLIASGAAVLAVSRGDEIPYYHANLRWIKGDLTSGNFSLQGYCVDVVVHIAPLPLLPPLLELFANAEAKRIIAYSSTSVFAKLLSTNQFERDFAVKLQAAEEAFVKKCVELEISHTIFRPTLTYGLGMDNSIRKIAAIIRKFGRIFVYPPAFGRRQPVHADDLATATVQAIENEKTFAKAYNLSGGEIIIYRDMIMRIFTLYGKKPKIISTTALPFILDILGKLRKNKHLNGELARRMNDDFVFFNDDARQDFGFHPRSFLSGGIKDIEGF
jgi:nucleoside-diphosphate-sugar epimerase